MQLLCRSRLSATITMTTCLLNASKALQITLRGNIAAVSSASANSSCLSPNTLAKLYAHLSFFPAHPHTGQPGARCVILTGFSAQLHFSSFWIAQLNKIDQLLLDTSPIQAEWDALIPYEIRPETGKIKLVSLSQLALSCGAGAEIWLHQFIFGIPIVGRLS